MQVMQGMQVIKIIEPTFSGSILNASYKFKIFEIECWMSFLKLFMHNSTIIKCLVFFISLCLPSAVYGLRRHCFNGNASSPTMVCGKLSEIQGNNLSSGTSNFFLLTDFSVFEFANIPILEFKNIPPSVFSVRTDVHFSKSVVSICYK